MPLLYRMISVTRWCIRWPRSSAKQDHLVSRINDLGDRDHPLSRIIHLAGASGDRDQWWSIRWVISSAKQNSQSHDLGHRISGNRVHYCIHWYPGPDIEVIGHVIISNFFQYHPDLLHRIPPRAGQGCHQHRLRGGQEGLRTHRRKM